VLAWRTDRAGRDERRTGCDRQALPEHFVAAPPKSRASGGDCSSCIDRLGVLRPRDFFEAFAVFVMVVVATFPVVVPFLLTDDVATAMHWSQAITLGMLFLAGLRSDATRDIEAAAHRACDGRVRRAPDRRREGAGRMKLARFASALALAGSRPPDRHKAPKATRSPSRPGWAAVTGMYYAMRDQPDFGVGVGSLNRVRASRSALQLRGARRRLGLRRLEVRGRRYGELRADADHRGPVRAARGVIPGLEASIGWRTFDIYVEAEYVRDLDETSASYFYSWTELGWRPVEWLRVGLVGQRTHTVDNGRDLQRGIFGQVVVGKATLGVYGFNPDSGSRYVIVSLGVAF
jgi:hypothetical protein